MGIISQKKWLTYLIFCTILILLWGINTKNTLKTHQERFISDAITQFSIIKKLNPAMPIELKPNSSINAYDTFLTLGHYQHRTNQSSTIFINKIPTPPLKHYEPFIQNGVVLIYYRFLTNKIELFFPSENTHGYYSEISGGDFFTQRRTLVIFFAYGSAIIIVLCIGWLISINYAKSHDAYLLVSEKNIQSLKQTALTDKLTQISNRLKGDDALNELIERSNRFHQPFSLIMFDVDHFKKINDTYGHDAGDEVLIGLSKYVKNLCKSSDIFVRWGGEEFIILLPGTTLDNALIFANKLCKGIAKQPLIEMAQVTCSFGVATHKVGEHQNALLKRVDLLLYRAKNNGRNRVEASSG